MPEEFDALPPLEAHRREVVKVLSFGVATAYGVEVEGDIAEFGTMTGTTAVVLAKAIVQCDASLGYALDAAGLPRKELHLFDSFEGLPDATTEIDARSPHVRSGVWAPGSCVGLTKEQLFQRVAEIMEPSRIRIFEGWFRDTLPTVPQETVYALVHIDSNLYESARDVLDYLFGHKMIAEGALLLFDNWNCNRGSPEFGERRAWSESVGKYRIRYSDEGGYGLFSHRFLIHGYNEPWWGHMSESSKTVEKQYGAHFESRDKYGLVTLGVVRSGSWHSDPRHMVFVLARYKFVAKMLSGRRHVLEVGCGDAWCVPVVLQEVGHIHGIDIDPLFIEDANAHVHSKWSFTCAVHDMLSGPVNGSFDAAYSLDVLEHIPPQREDTFVSNVVDSLAEHGVLIIGTPSIQSQQYASAISKAGHVNCKDGPGLKALMGKYFHNVFIFSMNDEVVHTGFYPMAQYLLALCVGKRIT